MAQPDCRRKARRVRGAPSQLSGAVSSRDRIQPMLLVPLHHDQRIARLILERDVPGLLRAAAGAADREPGALAERVERQAAVLSEDAGPPASRSDRAAAR